MLGKGCPIFYGQLKYMEAAPKVMSPILLYWPTTSEVVVGSMAVEIESSHYILLPCDRWQQRGSLIKWHLTWKCIRSEGVSSNSSMQKKLHPLTFVDACWTLMDTKQWMWAQWGGGWCASAVVATRVGQLHWCRFLWAWHAGSCSSMMKKHS